MMDSFVKYLVPRTAAFLCLCVGLMVVPAWAVELKKPSSAVVLTVSGNINATNVANEKAQFDIAMLDKLPQTSFKTSTIWTQGTNLFSGVELKVFLESIGAQGKKLRMVALNDYAIEIPFSEGVSGGPILATRMNGALLTVRDKGPIWLVFPYDSKSEYRSETTYSRSIWQLKSIEVKD